MKLYIANVTKQNHTFTYRVPDAQDTLSRPRAIAIPAGGQKALPDDLSTIQIDAVISQHAMYGLVAVNEAGCRREFNGLVYSIDSPVNIGAIRQGISSNDAVLRVRGEKFRQEAGMAAFTSAEQSAERVGASLNAVELSVVEDRPERNDGFREGAPVADGVRVSRREDPNPVPNNKRRGR